MLQHARTPGKVVRARGGGGPAPAGDKQSRVGNAALQERSTGAGKAAGVSDEEAASWIADAQSHPEGPELQEEGAVGPMRPTAVKEGMKGALIWNATEVALTKDAEGRQPLVSVADGASAVVVEVQGERIKVSVRSGKENVEGWVDARVFSEQPTLTPDDDDKALAADYAYSKIEGDHSPVDPKGKDTAQGSAGDCFLIASMAAVANASPQAITDAIEYDPQKGTYTVRFYEESYSGYKPVYIEVDGYLPTSRDNRKDPVYAGDEGGVMWSAIMEKAYAKWKGGYDVINEGGTGSTTMAELTGVRSQNKSPSSMKEADVVPYFEAAKKEGKAIYAGVKDSRKSATQNPFSGEGDGPFKGKVSQTHRWNEIVPGSLEVTDGDDRSRHAYDTGSEGDKTGELRGPGVKEGTVAYKGDNASEIELAWEKGRGPKDAGKLQVDFDYEGVLDTNKFVIGNHAYAFEGVVDGKELQFYNPWGTYQPKPITPAEFLQLFDSLSVNQVPKGKTQS